MQMIQIHFTAACLPSASSLSLSLSHTARGWHCCTAKLLHHDEEFRPAAAVGGVDDSWILPAGLHRWFLLKLRLQTVLHCCRCVLTSPLEHSQTHTEFFQTERSFSLLPEETVIIDVKPYKPLIKLVLSPEVDELLRSLMKEMFSMLHLVIGTRKFFFSSVKLNCHHLS